MDYRILLALLLLLVHRASGFRVPAPHLAVARLGHGKLYMTASVPSQVPSASSSSTSDEGSSSSSSSGSKETSLVGGGGGGGAVVSSEPVRKGPISFLVRTATMSVLVIKIALLKTKISSLEALSVVSKKLRLGTGGADKGSVDGSSGNGNKKNSNNNNNNNSARKKKNKASTLAGRFLDTFKTLLTSRKFWMQASLATISFVLFRKYVLFTKSLTREIAYSQFFKLLVEPERIKGLTITPSRFLFLLDGKSCFARIAPIDNSLVSLLLLAGVDFAAAPTPTNVLGLAWTFFYAAFLWNVSSRMMQGPQDEGAGKRRDQMSAEGGVGGGLSFDDVAGQERAKLEVKEVCEMLKTPERFSAVGARLPSGVLLVGPPGTGKTLLARVAAADAGVPFYACSATDFVEVFVGRGPARVRKLFKSAAENAPCIVFIDEIDSLGRSRRMGSLNSEQENTLNQLLTSMDGLDTSNNGVIVMAATNRYELLDPALLRAGRFDRIVQCPLPDRAGRFAILNVHTKRLKLGADVDLDRVAKLTPGTCGADLSAIANEAAIRTARRGGGAISNDDFDDALRSFFSARGLPLSGLAESVGLTMPSWLKGQGGVGAQAAPAA